MNVPTRLTSISAIAAVLYASASLAGESDAPMFTFNGFGTFGVVHSSEDRADFTSGVRSEGAGFARDWSSGVDSLIAAQVDANFTPKLSAVLQVLSEQNYDGSYRPHVEWANVKYKFTPDFSVRLGRTVYPLFQLSDTRKVGLTYPWVRPPLELYQLSPIATTDGADVSYRMHFGEWAHTLQLRYGSSDTELPDDAGKVKARNLWMISNTADFGPLSAHFTYVKTKVSVAAYDPLFDAFRQFGPQGVAIADSNVVSESDTSFVVVGVSYDPGEWFAMTEWGRFDSDSVLGTRTAWYVSGGYRFGKLTPYVTYANASADKLSAPGLDVSTLPPFLAGPAMGLNAAFNATLSQKAVENTASLGARWDFAANVALKLQFDHMEIGDGSTGVLTNTQPDYPLGTDVNVFSATIDFVF
jgi:hypothetical protein